MLDRNAARAASGSLTQSIRAAIGAAVCSTAIETSGSKTKAMLGARWGTGSSSSEGQPSGRREAAWLHSGPISAPDPARSERMS